MKKKNGESKAIIQINFSTAEKLKQYNIQITKKTIENGENFEIVINVDDDEQYAITLLSELKLTEQKINLNSSISYEKDIIKIGLKLDNTTSINTEFDKKTIIEKSNNIVLNNLQQERRISIINQIKERTSRKNIEKLNSLTEVLGLKQKDEETESQENQMSQTEINNFNAKFEFFTGKEVSTENISSLLEIVKNNLNSYELVPIENESEESNETQQENKYKIKLNIEKDKINETATNEILNKIEHDKRYDITISYKQGSGLIDYIIIKEVKK